jgi:hypothetical protein
LPAGGTILRMANPELKWWHVRWRLWGRHLKKVGFWLAIVLAVGWTIDLALVCGLKFFGPYFTVWNLRNEPEAWLVPTPVPDRNVVRLSGTKVEAYGYSIQTPWNEQPEIHSGALSTTARFPKEGATLVFMNPDLDRGHAQTWRTTPAVVGIFHDKERRSNYGLMAAAMATTPRDAAWWRTPRENQRVLALLSCKFFAGTEPSAIYNVNGPAMRGFQFESQLLQRKLVQLSLFDSADRQLDIQIFNGMGDKPTVTQAQINSMVASISLSGHK